MEIPDDNTFFGNTVVKVIRNIVNYTKGTLVPSINDIEDDVTELKNDMSKTEKKIVSSYAGEEVIHFLQSTEGNTEGDFGIVYRVDGNNLLVTPRICGGDGSFQNGNTITVELPSGSSEGGGSSYELPIASADRLGGIKVGSGLSITDDGTLNVDSESYELPVATADTLGGIKIGDGLHMDENDKLNVDETTVDGSYEGGILSITVNGSKVDIPLDDTVNGLNIPISGITIVGSSTSVDYLQIYKGNDDSQCIMSPASVKVNVPYMGPWSYTNALGYYDTISGDTANEALADILAKLDDGTYSFYMIHSSSGTDFANPTLNNRTSVSLRRSNLTIVDHKITDETVYIGRNHSTGVSTEGYLTVLAIFGPNYYTE